MATVRRLITTLVHLVKSPFVLGPAAIGFAGLGFYYSSGTQKSRRTYEIGDQTGKTFIVMGATSGLGQQLTKDLANKNAIVVMACRNKHKCLEVRRDIVLRTRNKKVYCRMCDVSDPSSVHSFVQKLNSSDNEDLNKIDGLILNAAVKYPKYKVNTDGVEMNLATNHMGHFLLVGLLLQKLLDQNGPSKILFISTDISAKDNLKLELDKMNEAKYFFKMLESTTEKLDNVNGKYDMHGAYKFSKLMQLLFARELAERLKDNSKISVVVADPGGTKTALNRDEPSQQLFLTRWSTNFLGYLAGSRRKTEYGVAPLLYALFDPDVRNGMFINSRRKQREWGKNAEDNELRQKVWMMSERWTKLAEHMQTIENELDKKEYYSNDPEKAAVKTPPRRFLRFA